MPWIARTLFRMSMKSAKRAHARTQRIVQLPSQALALPGDLRSCSAIQASAFLQSHLLLQLPPSHPVLRCADLAAGLPGPHAIPADRLPQLVCGRDITATPRRVAATLLSCSLLLGLHPDQALGPTLELAAALRKPFAVVPCCVYAADFPRRRLRGGTAVRSYEQLLQWVGEWPGAQRCELPFSGRNVAFYSADMARPAAP